MPVAPSSTPNQIDEPRIEASLSQDACRAPILGRPNRCNVLRVDAGLLQRRAAFHRYVGVTVTPTAQPSPRPLRRSLAHAPGATSHPHRSRASDRASRVAGCGSFVAARLVRRPSHQSR
jgi:hypothetical protein